MGINSFCEQVGKRLPGGSVQFARPVAGEIELQWLPVPNSPPVTTRVRTISVAYANDAFIGVVAVSLRQQLARVAS
jgi:hypothetical protein